MLVSAAQWQHCANVLLQPGKTNGLLPNLGHNWANMLQRDDTTALDEPLYAHHARIATLSDGDRAPGELQELGTVQDSDGDAVLALLREAAHAVDAQPGTPYPSSFSSV